MQAPIDIEKPEQLPINNLKFGYQPADLDIVNDCNQYRIAVKFPDNYWLTVGKKPYNLAELHFRVPGESAVNGKRPRMAIQLLHFSPEGVFLVIEVPVVAGKENATIKKLWEHIPDPGKESKVPGMKINAADLLIHDDLMGFRRHDPVTGCAEHGSLKGTALCFTPAIAPPGIWGKRGLTLSQNCCPGAVFSGCSKNRKMPLFLRSDLRNTIFNKMK